MEQRFGSSLPLIRPFLVFLCGLLLGEFTRLSLPFGLPAGCLVTAVVVHRWFDRKPGTVVLKSVLVFSVFLFGGWWLISEAKQPKTAPLLEGRLSGVLELTHGVRCTSHRCISRAITILPEGSKNAEHTFSLSVKRTVSDTLIEGARYRFTGTVKGFSPPANPREFDRQRWAHELGITADLIIDTLDLLRISNPGFRDRGRRWLRGSLEAIGDLRVREMAYALLTGDKSELPHELRIAFARCGIMHLLAVSGLHVGLVAGLPMLMLRRTRRRLAKMAVAVMVVGVIWGFAWFTGLAASVIRAAAMLSLMTIGLCFFKRVSTLNSLAGVGLFMLATSPKLLFNPGFLLSFSAVAAIVMWTPLLTSWIPLSSSRIVRVIAQPSGVAIAAQAGTSGISVYFFGQLPLLFLPANLIAVPLATLVLYLLLLHAVLSALGASFSALGLVIEYIGIALIETATFIGSLSYAALDQLDVEWSEAVLWYLPVVAFMGVLAQRAPRKWWYMLVAAVPLLIVTPQRLRHDRQIILFTHRNELLIGLGGRSEHVLLLPHASTSRYSASGWVRHHQAREVVMPLDTLLEVNQLEVERKSSVLMIGALMFCFADQCMNDDWGHARMTLHYERNNVLMLNRENYVDTFDLSASALVISLRSDGTIAEVRGQRSPPTMALP